MAISLSINRRGSPPEDARDVPIATMAVFDRFWVPAIHALSLQWIPLFRTGTPLVREDVDTVVVELTALRRAVEEMGGEASENVLPRIDRLISELRSIGPEFEMYIG